MMFKRFNLNPMLLIMLAVMWLIPPSFATTQINGRQIQDATITPAKLSAQPSARVYRGSGTQSISNATFTALLWGAESWDSMGHSTSFNSNELTVPSGMGGKWLIVANVYWDANSAGVRSIRIRKNGSTIIAQGNVANAGGTDNPVQTLTTIVNLAATDYFDALVYQNSGGTMAVNAGEEMSYFAAYRLGP
jgi:hypothetical protein